MGINIGNDDITGATQSGGDGFGPQSGGDGRDMSSYFGTGFGENGYFAGGGGGGGQEGTANGGIGGGGDGNGQNAQANTGGGGGGHAGGDGGSGIFLIRYEI